MPRAVNKSLYRRSLLAENVFNQMRDMNASNFFLAFVYFRVLTRTEASLIVPDFTISVLGSSRNL